MIPRLACLTALLALGALACDRVNEAVEELSEELRPVGDRVNEAVEELSEELRPVGDRVNEAVEGLGEELRPVGDRVNEAVEGLGEELRSLEDRVNETSPPIRTASKFDPEFLATEITKAINALRLQRGRVALTVDPLLTEIAQAHSSDMAQHRYSAHVDSQGDDPTGRARKAGYDCRNPRSIGIAENINVVYGHTSSLRTHAGTDYNWMSNAEVVTRFVAEWLASPGHRGNIMDRRYKFTGVGVAFGTFRGIPHAIHVTQNFC